MWLLGVKLNVLILITICSWSKADQCENNTCSQRCQSTPSGPRCYCDEGFALDEKDNKTCTDVDECLANGLCSHTCNNTRGSYECVCGSGYELVNRTFCRAAGPDPLLVFSTLKAVRGMLLRSKQYFPIRNAESRATALYVEPYSEQIYWIDVSNQSTIYSTRLDGSGLRTILRHGLLIPEDIAVDYLARNVYLTDSGLKQVLACKTDGKMCHVLHNTGVEKPRSIALDLNRGMMYWSDWGEHSAGIYRSAMDGSSRIPIVSNSAGDDDPIGWPNGIALDPPTNRLYWADAQLLTIEFISLDDMKTRKVILNTALYHPYSLTVFEDTVYWSDWNSMSLESCNKFTGHKATIIARENGQHIMGIHVYHPVLATKKVSNPCWSHDCSHMCLRSLGRGYTCACPNGYKLSEDLKTCTLESKGDDIFVTEGSTIFHIRPKSVGSETLTELRLPLGNASISRVAFDSRSRYLFVADVLKPAIYAVNTSSLEIKELARNGIVSPEDLSFDWTSNNLYWIDSSKGTAEVVNVFLNRTVTLLTDLRPVALAISPNSGHMFIASIGIDSIVTMYGMDGKNMKIVKSTRGTPIALAVHPTKSLLYWADSRAGTISCMNYTISGRAHVLKAQIDGVMSVAVSDEDIYWTAGTGGLNMLREKVTFLLQLSGDEISLASRKVIYSSGVVTTGLCLTENGGCSHVCLTSPTGKTCACSPDTVLSGDNVTCVAKTCSATDFKCMNGGCLKGEKKCDGVADCEDGSDEMDCSSSCSADDFQCKNGRCILKSWRCDHRDDCGDNSDEKDCRSKAPTCSANEFQCETDKSCLAAILKCNGKAECKDESDEKNCPQRPGACREGMFVCQDGSCLYDYEVCDGHFDCSQNEDEVNCTHPVCEPERFLCPGFPTRCISKKWICDGDVDCTDGSDEENCGAATRPLPTLPPASEAPALCKPEELLCPESKRCISRGWVCDGKPDCSDGSDEEMCPTTTTLPTLSEAANCTSDQVTCPNGECVPALWRCDGEPDCPGGSDELDCDATVCDETDQFRCGSGQCVPASWRCDGVKHCFADGSDEKNCGSKATTCSANEFQCETDKSCLAAILKCNGKAECKDESDEKNCPQRHGACREGMFACKDGSCVFDHEVCDGHFDCSQNEDEVNCTPALCKPEELLCPESKRCISREWICDGKSDCPDGSDEEMCPTTTTLPTLSEAANCTSDQVTCSNGECVPALWRCDGEPDCPGGSDELNCDATVCDETDQFRCGSGQCLPASWRCDGVKHCFADGSDEKNCGFHLMKKHIA